MQFELKKVTEENQSLLNGVEVLPEQVQYSANGSYLIQYVKDKDITVYLILQQDKPVGCFYLTPVHDSLNSLIPVKNPIHLLALSIDYRQQGKGIAKQALVALIKSLDADQYDSLVISVNCKNSPAIKLYEKLDFKKLPELYVGGKAGPQWVMTYEL